MRPNILFRLALYFAAGVLLTAGSGPEKKKSLEPSSGNLIRKDLLAAKTEEFVPPLRDIFSPIPVYEESHSAPDAGLPGIGLPIPDAEGQPPGPPPFTLSYIGFIRSAQKTIALVIVEGQARAVAEGEEIFPGIKVKSVSVSQIEVVGPDSKISSFSRQGEQP